MSMEPNGQESWHVYRKLVLHELADIGDALERIEMRLNSLEQSVTALKIKAGLWGALAGAVPSAIAILVLYLENKL